MKYRKKSEIVDAFQWHGEEVPGHVRQNITHVDPTSEMKLKYQLNIKTDGGMSFASEGDYIVTNEQGKVYAYPQFLFEERYDAIE